jgi:hypothetical protein
MARENDLVATKRVVGRVHMECNAECDRAKAVR